LHAGAGAEARRIVRPVDPAGGLRLAAGAARRGVWNLDGPAAPAGARRWRPARSTAGRGAGRDLRRRCRARRVSPDPAGLGRAGGRGTGWSEPATADLALPRRARKSVV